MLQTRQQRRRAERETLKIIETSNKIQATNACEKNFGGHSFQVIGPLELYRDVVYRVCLRCPYMVASKLQDLEMPRVETSNPPPLS